MCTVLLNTSLKIFFLLQLVLPIVSIVIIILNNNSYYKINENKLGFFLSIITLLITCFLIYNYNDGFSIFQYTKDIEWNFFSIKISFGLDGISLLLILLTNYLLLICIILGWSTICYKNTLHLCCFFLIQFFINLSFSVLDLLWFYIFFEGVLIPMFILIGIWGSRERKIRATFQLFLYTLIGSLFLFFSIIYLYIIIGTTDIRILFLLELPFNIECVLWWCIFISFCIKIPLFPFHLWLPEAHVEASTTGSVILAGILLKLGCYGMFRFLISIFPIATNFFSLFVCVLCILGILYISFIIICQIDMKKIIAYSSVVHMSMAVLGIFSLNYYGYIGSLIMMISHGLVSSGLFILIGLLYKQSHTRNIFYFDRLVVYIPLFCIYLFFFTIFNIGFPGSSGFISELLIINSIIIKNPFLLLFLIIGYLSTVIYSIWLFNRICFGSSNLKYNIKYIDLKFEDIIYLFCICIIILLLGIFPTYICKICNNYLYSFCFISL